MRASETTLPEYRCRKIERPLNLSGKVDDPLWSMAEIAGLTDVYGQPGRYQTTVRLLYDQEFLYAGFNCQDEYVWSTITERDGCIWEEECVELFINPANVGHQYYEINVNPLNTVFDACIINGRTEEKPSNPFIGFPGLDFKRLTTAVAVSGVLNTAGAALGWSAEFKIPFDELFGADHVPPHPGDVWRVNFYRIDQPWHGEPEHYAWSRVDKVDFHRPWRFGRLIFD